MKDEDIILVKKCQEGDVSAFEQLVAKYKKRFMALLTRLYTIKKMPWIYRKRYL